MELASMWNRLFERLPISRDFGENVIWRTTQQATSMGTRFFVFFVAAKLFTPETFGRYNYLMTLFGLLTIFSNFGQTMSVSRYVAEVEADRRMSAILTVSIATSLLLTVVISILVLSFGGSYLGENYVYVAYILPIIFFNAASNIIDGEFRGLKKFRQLSTTTLYVAVITIVTAPYLIDTFGISGAIGAQGIYYFVLFAILAYRSDHVEIEFEEKISRRVVRYSAVLWVSSLAYFLYTRADILILEHYGFVTEIGYYEILDKFFMLVFIPFTIVGRVLAPDVTQLVADDEYRELLERVGHLKYVFALGIVLTAVFYLVLPLIIKFVFPKYYTQNFVAAMNIILLLIPFKITGVLLTNGYVVPSGYAKITTVATAIGGLANVTLDFVAIEALGFVGVFYVTLLVQAVNIVVVMAIFYYTIKKKASPPSESTPVK